MIRTLAGAAKVWVKLQNCDFTKSLAVRIKKIAPLRSLTETVLAL